MRFSRTAVLSFLIFLSSSPSLSAQNKIAQCGVSCEPDDTSGSYGATYAARPLSKNARSASSALAPPAKGADVSPGSPKNIVGSASYSYAIPILHLPGRSGLDLDLTLFYNSAIWTIVPNQSATLNADRDSPSYGFHLGYGLIEAPPSGSTAYLLTEPDGTQRQLPLVSGSTYATVDSSYATWNPASNPPTLQRKDGTIWQYQQVPSATQFYRPVKIIDTNGNFISIAYSTATGADKQSIATITDTVGRSIVFNYNGSNELASITAPAFGGGTKTVAYFTWSTLALKYDFGLSVNDSPADGATINVLTACNYANAAGTASGQGYTFAYGDWALVNKITQTSANDTARSYARYDFPPATSALSDAPTYQHQFVSSDGTAASEVSWAFQNTVVNGLTSSLAITNPAGTVTTTNLSTSGFQTGLPSQVTISIASLVFSTQSTTWTQDNPSSTTVQNPRVQNVSTSLGGSASAIQTFGYDANGNVTDLTETDYGTGTVRETKTTYDTSHASQHILNLPSQVLILDGSGNLQARTDIAYDSYGSTGLLGVTGAPQHDDSNYGSSFTARGNVTSTTRYTNASAATGATSRSFGYDTFGNLRSAQVDCCQSETWSYSSATQFAYPDSLTRGAAPTLTTSQTYDLGTGLVKGITDANGQSQQFSYDALNRATATTGPLGLSATTNYDDNSAQPAVTQTTAIDTGKSLVQISTADGSGRTVRLQTQDASGANASIVDTQYDSLGRVAKTSNPHSSSETAVFTQTQYDELSRISQVIPPDGSAFSNNTQYSYLANAVTITDPSGKLRRIFTDALGRTSEADEPGIGAATPGKGSVTIGGTLKMACDPSEPIPPLPRHCTMISDSGSVSLTVGSITASVNFNVGSTASNIAASLSSELNASGSPVTTSVSGGTISITAVQSGDTTNYPISLNETSMFNSFNFSESGATLTGGTNAGTPTAPSLDHPLQTLYTYNVLDELTRSVQGVQQRTFAYDSLGRLTQAVTPEAGTVSNTYTSFGLVQTRTDARGVITSYGYDGLNRLTQISYNVGSTGVPATPTVSFGYDAGGAAANALGRLTGLTDGVGGESYTYDALGRTTGLTKTISGASYPLAYSYDIVGDLKSITYPSGRVVQQQYDAIGRVNQIQSSGTNYLTGVVYNSASQPTAWTYGNGIQAAFGYNTRLQVQSIDYTVAAQTTGLSYGYTQNGGNTGQITSITDSGDAGRSVAYTYDPYGRLATAATQGSTNFPQWGLSWSYDRYGNRLSQALTAGSGPSNSVAVDPTTNRITGTGFSYDAAGNMTSDGLNTLAYDAENRAVTSTAGGASTYSYDGNGLRVKKVSGATTTVYIFSAAKVVGEYDNGAAVSTPTRENIYAGSDLLATLQGGGINYYTRDHLSVRKTYDASANLLGQQGHFPFGESWYTQGTSTKWQFTSYERDPESGNDYALARFNVNRLGRFSSPDPLAGAIIAPQSLNRYAYVANDPVNLVDPLGLFYLTCQLLGTCGSSTSDGNNNGGGGGGGGAPRIAQLGPNDAGGGGGTGGQKKPYTVNLKVLNDCLASLGINANVVAFKPSVSGGNGYAIAIGTDLFSSRGQNVPIVVTNDSSSYNAAQVGALCGLPAAFGCTLPGNPYNNFTNNNNKAFGTVVTQVHELGHSLFKITAGSNLIPEPNGEVGNALEDCVKQNHGIQRN
jgi:RHS repeat-associated protein